MCYGVYINSDAVSICRYMYKCLIFAQSLLSSSTLDYSVSANGERPRVLVIAIH
jgi:hypothetical protein